jgi:hypothetical protein
MHGLPRLSWVLAVAVLCGAGVVGCGDDDDASDDDSGGGRDSGTSGSGGSGPGIDAGPVGEGPGDEGWPCSRTDPCNDDLRCATTPFTVSGTPVGVCAAACEVDADCDGGQCISYTGAAADAHCVNVVDEEYEVCGVADTSVCSETLTCLYFPDLPVGVCVSLCATDGAAGGDDAGVDEPGLVSECSGDQSCIEGILADPTAGEGVCGMLVERGDLCGLDIGLYCPEGDVCAPEDPEDENSAGRCFQDCSTGTGSDCEEGTCVLIPNLFAYCI